MLLMSTKQSQQQGQHFADKTIGFSDAIKGELDGVPFHLYGMKEPDYAMQIMSMYGTMSELGKEKKACHHELILATTHL